MRLFLNLTLTAAISLSLFSFPACGDETDGLAGKYLEGTYEVGFEPVKMYGRMQGCSLTFKAVTLDRASRQLRPILLVGSIGFFVHPDKNVGAVSLNLGIREPHKDGDIRPPFFAYLKTPTDSTAKIPEFGEPSAGGLRLFVYALEAASAHVLKDIMDGKPVTIGFKPTKESAVILAPLDLTVVNSDGPGKDFKQRQTHSPLMVRQFSACFNELFGKMIGKK